MTKKVFKILGIVLAVVILLYVGWSVYLKIMIDRGDLIVWDGKTYTKEEFKNAFPPQEYNVPAKNTPEEVYTAFRQALLNNDIEGALGQIREENREEYRQAFNDKEKLDKWVKGLPEKITKENELGNFSYYDLDYKDGYEHTVEFLKGPDGYWRIDQI